MPYTPGWRGHRLRTARRSNWPLLAAARSVTGGRPAPQKRDGPNPLNGRLPNRLVTVPVLPATYAAARALRRRTGFCTWTPACTQPKELNVQPRRRRRGGLPLDADREPLVAFQLHPLDHAVKRIGADTETAGHAVHRCPVFAVDDDFTVAVDPSQAGAGNDGDGVAQPSLGRMPMLERLGPLAGQVVEQRTAKRDVQHVQAAVHREEGQPAFATMLAKRFVVVTRGADQDRRIALGEHVLPVRRRAGAAREMGVPPAAVTSASVARGPYAPA